MAERLVNTACPSLSKQLYSRAMGLRLVYGLKTDDASFLDVFYPSRRLHEASEALGLDYAACIHGETSPYERTLDFCRGNVALLRGELPMSLYTRLESDGVTVVNGSRATALAGDKLAAALHFASLDSRHPSTIEIMATPQAHQEPPPMPYPFIVKPRFGKMGRGVELIETAHQWAAFMASDGFKKTSYIAQEYLPASHGRDVRFFFALFESKRQEAPYIVAMRHGDALASNTHMGGSMERFNPPPSLVAEAERIYASSGLQYGSVDFLFADHRGDAFAVCETNACPGFEALEAMSGVDVARAILLSALGQEGRR